MILFERMKRAIALRKDDVFLRAEFADMASVAQVSRALRRLIEAGVIVKLGVGVYAKAKKSVLSGNPIPVRPLEVLAPQALEKMGVELCVSQNVADYNAGRTTQIPAGNVINTGERRITRKLVFGQQRVTYETNKRKTGESD